MRLVARPLPIAAVALLLLNDHWLKGASILPAALTGKLSDLAGLFFFPVLCFALVRAGWTFLFPRRGLRECDRTWLSVGCALGTGLVFTAAKLSSAFNGWFSSWWGTIALDATDLVALPTLALAVWWLRRAGDRPLPAAPRLELAAIVVAALASMATSPPAKMRNFPAWEIDAEREMAVGCGIFRVWVAKSGKEGVGITVRARAASDAPCEITVVDARLLVAGTTVVGGGIPVRRTVEPGAEDDIYVPFAFDNERLWNDGDRTGELQLRLEAGGQVSAPWRLPLTHRLRGFQRSRFERKTQ